MRPGSTNVVLYLTVAVAVLVGHVVESNGATKLSAANFDSTLSSHELVFVNFYANWCRFSQMLEPIYDEFATKAAQEFPANQLSIAKVDCDAESSVATQNHVNKYPTLKLYRYGQAAKREYRGARSVDAFMSYIREQIESKMKVVHDSSKLIETLHENKKRTIIGYFQNENSESYKTFLKLSSLLRDSCLFVSYLGDLNSVIHDSSERVTFKDMTSPDSATHEIIYDTGRITDYEKLYAWADERCTPLVREITFENAEELTEEGLPFLILFRKPDDDDSLRLFERQVQNQLVHMKHTINAVYADGNKFTHPLHHLGKTINDLPVLAIDSFRHMYLFPDFKKLGEGGHLIQFVQDLHSGKLHREFHNGPDPTTPAPAIELHVGNQGQHIPKIPDPKNPEDPNSIRVNPSTPPESVFIKLAPSRERYSLKYDGEL